MHLKESFLFSSISLAHIRCFINFAWFWLIHLHVALVVKKVATILKEESLWIRLHFCRLVNPFSSFISLTICINTIIHIIIHSSIPLLHSQLQVYPFFEKSKYLSLSLYPCYNYHHIAIKVTLNISPVAIYLIHNFYTSTSELVRVLQRKKINRIYIYIRIYIIYMNVR